MFKGLSSVAALAAIAAIATIAILLVIASFQAQMLFPTHAVGPAGPMPPGAEQVLVETSDGQQLHGLHVPPAKDSGRRLLVLGFGGNAWNGADVAAFLHRLYPQAHVVVFHYRGYRPSTGSPSAEVLLADAPLVLDFAVDLIRPQATVVVGFSIGSGIAASLSNRREIDGLVLVTPFDSLKAVAASLFPWLPVGPFFAHEIDTVAALKGASVPVAIIAAGRDEIIPPARTDALRQKIEASFDRTIATAGHNDIYERPDFAEAMHAAMEQVTAKVRKK